MPSDTAPPTNPYDELPYWSFAIEWTAPERLALTSLLHGGPRLDPGHCRVLEIGCANGANLLPMAWFRPGVEFTGLDASARQIEEADSASQALGLQNLRFIHADLRHAGDQLEGPFDIILAHGVFSWVTDEVREAMMALCRQQLAPAGLLYLNYNTYPGWNIRGMVRDYLLDQTRDVMGLRERAEACREAASRMVAPLQEGEHAYTRLMENEFQLVIKAHPAYIAHEYLSPENQPFWRSEFLGMAAAQGFEYVADADFDGPANQIMTQMAMAMRKEDLTGRAADDSADLLCYRQMHSPVLALAPLERRACSPSEFAALRLAAQLERAGHDAQGRALFRHASGPEITVLEDEMADAFARLNDSWPLSLPVSELFADSEGVQEDLENLCRQQLVELRMTEPGESSIEPGALHEFESRVRQCLTSPWHRLFAPPAAG